MNNRLTVTAPISDKDVKKLRIGDNVLINGIIYTARDTAHKRLLELIKQGKQLPIDLKGQIIYYAGPCPAPPGKPIGSIGPTTSSRMDPYTPALLEKGLKGTIGKGNRSTGVIQSLKKHSAVYFTAVGGAGALIATKIVKAEVIAYSDLGPEAIHRLEVKDFPVIVALDCHGGNLFEEEIRKYKTNNRH